MKKIFLLLSFYVLMVTSCSNPKKTNKNIMETDLQKITQVLNVKHTPIECKYQVVQQNDFFNEQKMIVILKYDDTEIKNIIDNSKLLDETIDFFDRRLLFDWLPEEIKSEFSENDETLKISNNTLLYSLEGFSKAPFLNGFILIKSPWIFIYCYSI